MSTNVYKLQYPIEREGRVIETLTFRRAKYKDLQLAEAQTKGKDKSEMTMALICNLTNISPEDFKEIDVADYVALGEFAKDFFGASGKPTTQI